jgi:purine-nucleoside phosphorylase
MVDRQKLSEAVTFLRESTAEKPKIALILGSGLGGFADQIDITNSLPSSNVPHYPVSTVTGHEGRLVFGRLSNGTKRSPKLLVFKGRVHYYETGNLSPVFFPVHLAKRLGVHTLLVTNAAGGINRTFEAGDLMLIEDVLNQTFLRLPSPKRSPSRVTHRHSDPELLIRGAHRSTYFDSRLQEIIRKTAQRMELQLREGTYCWLKGPTYETAAEVEMLRRLGADAVGMSTVPEIAAASHLGIRVAAISLISNLATGITGQALSHDEVTETGDRVRARFTSLLRQILLSL